VARPRERGSRCGTTRRRGSTRTATRAGPSSADDPPGEPEQPPRLRLWRRPDLGKVTPNLYRVLLAADRAAAS
jgi:hypothetical protein